MVHPWSLDIGCGQRKQPGHIGLDHSRASDADIVADLGQGLPFRDGIFEKIWVSHVYEHVPDPLALMDEIWRVSADGAIVEIRGPHFSSPHLIWGDPTHRRGLSLATFVYFEGASDWFLTNSRFEIKGATLMKGNVEFGDVKSKVWYWPWVFWNKGWQWLINSSPQMILRYERLLGRFIAFQELRVVLRVLKDATGRVKVG
jgi:SAM-dependent methyltransferase